MKTSFRCLSNNQLKIIAMVTMLSDHIGKELFPQFEFLQIIGRLSFPIFAYMIAEGCLYTRDRKKYLLRIAVLAAGCQAVYFIAERSFYQNVLVTFSLSVLTIYIIENFKCRKNSASAVLMFSEIAAVLFLIFGMPEIIKGFHIDYGIFGLLLPIAVYFAPNRFLKVISFLTVLIMLSFDLGGIQWFSLLSVIPVLLYNENRGKLNMKYLFYVFYPLHLALIYIVKLLFF